MLFHRHERSQRLLGDLANNSDASEASERTNIEMDRWKTGQSSAGESDYGPIADASSSLRGLQQPSLRLTYPMGIDTLPTMKILDKATNGADTAIASSKETKSPTYDCSQTLDSLGGETGVIALPTKTKQDLISQKRTPDMQPQSDVELSEYSPPELVPLLSHTSVPQPRLSSPRGSITTTGTHPGDSIGSAIITPRHATNETEHTTTGSPLGTRHRDIALVTKYSQRSSSVTSSVISTSSSAAGKSSSSSVSSTLRLSICHICKKPPFRKKLKGCFECSRHYHKGCAKPKDRITEDSWVCRSCLNKVARKAEPPLPSSSKPLMLAPSERLQEPQKVLASAHTPCSMGTSSTLELNSISDPLSLSSLRSEGLDSNKPVNASKPLEPGTQLNLPSTAKDHSPTPALHCTPTSKPSATLAPINAKDTTIGTFKPCTNGLPPRIQGPGSTTNTVDAQQDLALSSPPAAPSLLDGTIKTSTHLPLPMSSNHIPRSVNSPDGDPRIFPQTVDRREGHTRQRQPFFPTETLATEHSSVNRESAMSLSFMLLPKDNLAPGSSGQPYEGSPCASREEAPRTQGLVSVIAPDIPEPPYVSGPTAQCPDNPGANRAEIIHGRELSPKTATQETDSNLVPPVEKLCTQCRRSIIGSSLICTKCREANDSERSCRSEDTGSNERASAVDMSTMAMTGSRKTLCVSGALKECQCSIQEPCQDHNGEDLVCEATNIERAPNEKPHLRNGMASPLLKHARNTVPDSPFIPETPELLCDKTSTSFRIPHDGKTKKAANQHEPPNPLIPQKRPAIRPTVMTNEHCFSKKRLKVYKPVVNALAVKVPPASLNKLPPTPKSDSPRMEHSSRDASVQTRVETVHRETSPSTAPYNRADRIDTAVKGSAPSDACIQQATSLQSDISAVEGAQFEDMSFSPYSGRKSRQKRVEKQGYTLLEQQAGGFALKDQEFEQAEGAIARLQRPSQESSQCPTQNPSDLDDPEEGSCTLMSDERVVPHHSINLGEDPVETSYNWSLKDEKVLLDALQRRGVMFEEDYASESEGGMPPPRPKPVPKYPLRRRPVSSTDLFLIAPTLNPSRSSFDVERKREEIAARPPRKQKRLNISYLRRQRGENVHEEVRRIFSPRMVKVSSIVTSSIGDSMDENTGDTGTERRAEVEMTFSDFIGVPAKPMAILTRHKQLAYRDGTRDAKGYLPRAREKFTVTDRSVACMEN